MSEFTPALCASFLAKTADLVKVGNHQQALNIYDKLIEKISGKLQQLSSNQQPNPQLYQEFVVSLCRVFCNASLSHMAQQNYEKATESANKATDLLPNRAEAWSRVAISLEARKKYREAAICYREAATVLDRQNAESPEVYREKANNCDKNAEVYQPGQAADESLFSGGLKESSTSCAVNKESWYVDKYRNEAEDARKSENFKLAAELFGKAAEHEKNRIHALPEDQRKAYKDAVASSNASSSPPAVAILLVNKAAMLNRGVVANGGYHQDLDHQSDESSSTKVIITKEVNERNKATLLSAITDTQEALVACNNNYPRAHARLITLHVALGKLRTARTILEDAQQLFSNGDEQGRTIIKKSEEELAAAEKVQQDKIDASNRELEQQKQELENALRSRNQVGDSVSVDNLKKRKTEEIGSVAGGIGSKNISSYEYCKFCSMTGHTAARCPLKKQQ